MGPAYHNKSPIVLGGSLTETHTEIFSTNSPLEILDLAGLAALERYQKISTIQERVDVILRESEW